MTVALQFKSLRLPVIMLLTIPVSLRGIVLGLIAGGQGFSFTALGVKNVLADCAPAENDFRPGCDPRTSPTALLAIATHI